jgi:hypothetical protein
LGGRDVQLDRLGNILTTSTNKTKKRFAPSDELSLPDNVLGSKKAKEQEGMNIFICWTVLTIRKANSTPGV